MIDRRPSRRIFAVALILPLASAAAYAGSEFMAEPSWQPVSAEAVRTRLEEYLQTAHIAADSPNRSPRPVARPAGDDADADMLDRLAQCLAKADDRVAELDRVLLRPSEARPNAARVRLARR